MLGMRPLGTRITVSVFFVLAAAVALWALSVSEASETKTPSAAKRTAARDAGGRPFLGVELEEETEYAEGGARIVGVVDDSAAERAGLREGDIVVRFDGKTVRGPGALGQRIRESKPGDEVAITVVRDGKTQEFGVKMGSRAEQRWYWSGDEDAPQAFRFFGCDPDDEDCNGTFSFSCSGDDCDEAPFGLWGGGHRPLLGVQLIEVTPELREHLGEDGERGVLVGQVTRGSAAAAAGIAVGDLIVAVGGDPVSDAGDVRRALRKRAGETFEIEVIRDHHSTSLEVTLEKPEDSVPTGPRAWRLAPRSLSLEHVMEGVHEALRDAGLAQFGVHGTVTREMREAARGAREAMRRDLARHTI